jgi:hypothetical protein
MRIIVLGEKGLHGFRDGTLDQEIAEACGSACKKDPVMGVIGV